MDGYGFFAFCMLASKCNPAGPYMQSRWQPSAIPASPIWRPA